MREENARIAADADTEELGAAEFERLRRPQCPRVAVKRAMLGMRASPTCWSICAPANGATCLNFRIESGY